MMRTRKYAAEVMRFVRGAQAMTHDERVWFIQNIEPIIERAIAAEREACIQATLRERVDADATQTDEDEAYNTALMHAVEAMQKRSNAEAEGPERR